MPARPCPHGDQLCPCNDDGEACHYEPLEMDGHISPPAPCSNPTCIACGRA